MWQEERGVLRKSLQGAGLWLPLLSGSSEADPEMRIHEKVIWRRCSQEKWVRKRGKRTAKEEKLNPMKGRLSLTPLGTLESPRGVMLASGKDAGLLYSRLSPSLAQGCPWKDETVLVRCCSGHSGFRKQGQFSEGKHKGGLCRQKHTEVG